MTPANHEFVIAETVDDDLLQTILNGLNEHSLQFTTTKGFLPLSVHVKNASGEIVAGAIGKRNWNWLYVELLWVDKSLRGTGLGRKLLTTLEEEGRRRGCERAHLDTFSFQARGFYERCGYETFAILDDYPPGHQRIYLKKVL